MAGEQDCLKMVEEILSYLDGELEEPACRDLEKHLRECRKCAACRDILQKTILLCKDREHLPEEARDKILAAVKQEMGKGKPGN